MKLRERKKTKTNVEMPNSPKTKTKSSPMEIKTMPNKSSKRGIPKPKDVSVRMEEAISDPPTSRVTRSKIPKPVLPSNKKEKAIQPEKEKNASSVKRTAKPTSKGETSANPITNYFKKDTSPKDQNLIPVKKTRWANASSLLKTKSKPNADPYEFVDDLPKQRRKSKRRTASRSVPYTKLKKDGGKSSKLSEPEQLKDPVLPSTLTDKENIVNGTHSKGKTLPSLRELNVSNNNSIANDVAIVSSHDLRNEKAITNNEGNEHGHEKAAKNDKQADKGQSFKTPVIPTKPLVKGFFIKVTAVSTPKVTSNATEATSKQTKTISADSYKEKTNADSENSLLTHMDVSPINSGVPDSNSQGKIAHGESDINIEMDFAEDNEENSRILSGSFVGSENGVYDDENLKRASTPDNEYFIDSCFVSRNAIRAIGSLNDLAPKSPDTSGQRDAYSLYGSPIRLSPVKPNNFDGEENRPVKCSNKMNRWAKENTGGKPHSDKSIINPVKKTYGKKERKPKKEDPSDAAFEKWLRDMTNEFEQVQKFDLIVE